MKFNDNMMRVFKMILVAVALFFTSWQAGAQKITMNVNAPSVVAVGEIFKVEYSINAKPSGFTPPSIEGFDIIAGPTTSHSERTYVSGGNMVQTETYSYTYVLMGNTPGNFTIPSSKAVVDGKEYSSKAIPIEVVKEEQTSGVQQGQNGGQRQNNAGTGQDATTLAPDDIVVRAVIDKTNVYKGQPVRLSFKLYTRVPIAGLESIKYPAFNGFWTQELSTDHYTWQRETYRSKVYDARILREYLLFPQQAGLLQIEQLDLTVVAQIVMQNQRQSIFDDFFGGGPDIKQISRKINSETVRVKVNEWPAGAPVGFSGAVGNFTMSSDFPSGSIGVNSSATYVLKISGTGNLPLIQAPKIEVPSSFEQYNVKTTESLNKTVSGISGYRQFEYPLIARAEGNYLIDPIQFTFFNPETARYVTLTAEEKNVQVLADSTGNRGMSGGGGLVTGFSKEDVKLLGQDIRFIKLGSSGLKERGRSFVGSLGYYMMTLLIAALFVFALIYLKKRIKLMHDVDILRGKRANKVALQRLKAAEQFMSEGSQRNFFEEMLKALWGYMGDKLNIPVATLTKENVREGLLKRNTAPDLIDRYMELISDCEYAQYSPAVSGQMRDIYRVAVECISKLESVIKK